MSIEPATGADLDALEQEREFLFRSLADLDDEHEVGDIEDDDYRSLTDEYTARAAAVLRAIEAARSPNTGAASGGGAPSNGSDSGRPTSHSVTTGPAGPARRAREYRGRARTESTEPIDPKKAESRVAGQSQLLTAALRSRRRWRMAAIVTVVVVFGCLAAWAVTQSSGSRLPGQTSSGNRQLAPGSTVSGGVDQRLVQATNLVNQGKVADALKLYDAVLKEDPNQPVALADGGWLEAQAGLSATRPDLIDTGLAKIEKAEKIAPSFPDAHFFRGFLLLRAKNDAPGAVTELRLYLGTADPTGSQISGVQNLLQEAIKAAGASVPPGPNAPSTTAASSATPPTTAAHP